MNTISFSNITIFATGNAIYLVPTWRTTKRFVQLKSVLPTVYSDAIKYKKDVDVDIGQGQNTLPL
jgi:hypothetical protein